MQEGIKLRNRLNKGLFSYKEWNDLFFYIPYILWLSMNVLVDSAYEMFPNFSLIFSMVNVISMLFIFIHLLNKKISVKMIPLLFLCGVCVLVSAFNTGLLRTVFPFLFMIAASDMNWKQLIKVSLIVECILMLFIFCSFLCGILPNESIQRLDGSYRYYMGYTYTTLSANYFFHMVLMYLFVKNKKMQWPSYIIIILLNIFFFITTDTKTIFILIFLILICVFSAEHFSLTWIQKKKVSVLLHNIFYILSFASIELILAFRWGSWFYTKINTLLTNRLSLGRQAYDQYGISILGQKITWNTEFNGVDPYLYVDCAYMNIAINYGIVILILLCVGFTWVIGKAIKEKNIMLMIICLFLAVHSITDPQIYMMWYNPFLLFIGASFYKKNDRYIILWKIRDSVGVIMEEVKSLKRSIAVGRRNESN